MNLLGSNFTKALPGQFCCRTATSKRICKS